MKNTTVLKHLAASCLAGLLLLYSFSVRADIVLTPSTASVIGVNLGPSNCEPGCVYTTFGLTNDGSLSLFYKGEADGGADEGTFASSYNTVFSNTSDDPSNALLSYIGGSVITCPECYLAIKDGNQNPSYYFYDLASWDGTEDIVMTDFWPNRGAISHVSIWGREGDSTVPEPATLALVGLALAATGLRRKRIR